MSKYIKIVESLVDGINAGYKAAKDDLFEVVEEIASALRTILPDSKITIENLSDASEGTFFRISIDLLPKDESVKIVRLGTYFVPSAGYPISTGRFLGPANYDAVDFFGDRDSLDSYFQEFFNSPGSSLVQTMGFALRRREMDDEIPF